MAYWEDVSHLTPYAQKYGQAYLDIFDGNSGVTPRPEALNPPQQPLSIDQSVRLREYENYERHVTGGFTVPQMLACRAVNPPDASDMKENNLTNELCPVFARENWSVAKIPSKRWTDEYNFNDDTLWGVLLPVLRLASHMLTSNYTCDWWDALVMGPREDITPDRLPDNPKRIGIFRPERFLPRSPSERHLNGADWQALTKNITWRIQVGLRGKGFRGDTGIYESHHIHGICRQHPELPGNIQISVAYEEIRPLMPSFEPRLSTSDRLIQQFQLAVTYIHELAHGVNMLQFYKKVVGGLKPIVSEGLPGKPVEHVHNNREPYYMDEFVSELGYSMENSLFDGHFRTSTSTSVRDQEHMTFSEVAQHMSLGWAVKLAYSALISSYPDMRFIKNGYYNQDDELKNEWQIYGHPPMENPRFPICTSYYEEVQQQSFWDQFVTKFGGDRLKITPRFVGWVEKMGRWDDTYSRTIAIGDDYRKYLRYVSAERMARMNSNFNQNNWIDNEIREVLAIRDETDLSKSYRMRRIRRDRMVAADVHEQMVREQKQKKANEIAMADPAVRRLVEGWERVRDEQIRVYEEGLRARQLESRREAEEHSEYRPPMVLTFRGYVDAKTRYEEGYGPPPEGYPSDGE